MTPGDLDVHLQGGDAVRGAGDLEVHVAEVILDAGDVGQDDEVVALLDQAHRDAGDRARDGHAGGHQGHRRSADGAHRRGAVGLERLGDHPHHVGEVLLARDRGNQSALGERAVADVAALRAAHEARLPDRERREVVVVPEGLRLLQAQVVDPHVHAARPERDVGEDLRLAAGEQRRAVDPRRDVHLALDRPDLVLCATVGTLLVDRDPRRMISFSSLSKARETSARSLGVGIVAALGAAGVCSRTSSSIALTASWRASFSWICVASSSFAPCEERISLDKRRVDLRGLDLDLVLAGLVAQLLERGADLLDLLVGDVERVEDLSLGDALGAALDHQDRLLGSGDDQVHLEVLVDPPRPG